jgi:hypothetical protein
VLPEGDSHHQPIGRVFGDQPAVQTVFVQTSAQTPRHLQTEPST